MGIKPELHIRQRGKIPGDAIFSLVNEDSHHGAGCVSVSICSSVSCVKASASPGGDGSPARRTSFFNSRTMALVTGFRGPSRCALQSSAIQAGRCFRRGAAGRADPQGQARAATAATRAHSPTSEPPGRAYRSAVRHRPPSWVTQCGWPGTTARASRAGLSRILRSRLRIKGRCIDFPGAVCALRTSTAGSAVSAGLRLAVRCSEALSPPTSGRVWAVAPGGPRIGCSLLPKRPRDRPARSAQALCLDI